MSDTRPKLAVKYWAEMDRLDGVTLYSLSQSEIAVNQRRRTGRDAEEG
jgi:hypothetical protein